MNFLLKLIRGLDNPEVMGSFRIRDHEASDDLYAIIIGKAADLEAEVKERLRMTPAWRCEGPAMPCNYREFRSRRGHGATETCFCQTMVSNSDK